MLSGGQHACVSTLVEDHTTRPISEGNLSTSAFFSSEEIAKLRTVGDVHIPELVQGLWTSIHCTFRVVGLHNSTSVLTRSILREVFEFGGLRAICRTVSNWNRLTRVILADEDHTRTAKVDSSISYAKLMKNSYRRLHRLTNCRVKLTVLKSIAEHQGTRLIPPYLLDPILLEGMLPDPDFEHKARIVHLSNLKRILPPADHAEVIRSLEDFRNRVESPPQYKFDFTKVMASFAKANFSPSSSRILKSSWDLSNHGTRESPQVKGGKTQEIIDQVIDQFCSRSITEFFPYRPEQDLYDVLNVLILARDDWDEDLLLGDVIYRWRAPESEDHVDERLGHIGLFWAMHDLRSNRGIGIRTSNEFLDSLTFPKDQVDFSFSEGFLRSRISPQPEEGWKVRVITLTTLSAVVVGQVARKLLDPNLHSISQIRIGLLEKAKLFKILEHVGGKGTANADSNLFNCTPRWSESVDLTAATDCPSRKAVRTTLQGHLKGTNHGSSSQFLDFSVALATCDRRFDDSVIKGCKSPIVHNRGIMMGEGLSGIFLNDMSALVCALAPHFTKTFKRLRDVATMSIEAADAFIYHAYPLLQYELDHFVPIQNRSSTQSGDDVVLFANSSVNPAMMVLYRMFEMEPSRNTWFSSNKYCTFTEEAAIRTFDSIGWKFVDSIKSRIFQMMGIDPHGSLLPSKISLLTSYIRYDPIGSSRRRICCEIADEMISRHPAWNRIIQKHRVPVGLPPFLGGISHPEGLNPNYSFELLDLDQRVIKGISELEVIEGISLILGIDEDGEPSDALQIEIERISKSFFNLPTSDVVIEDGFDVRYDIEEICPVLSEPWWVTKARREKFMRDNKMMSLYDFVSSIKSGVNCREALAGVSNPVVKAYRSTANRLIKLRERFQSTIVDDISPEALSIWKIQEKFINQSKRVIASTSFCESLYNRSNLPSLVLRLVH